MTTTKDRHKHPAIAFRPPEHDRRWLAEYAESAGRPVNAVIAEALAAYRKRIEAAELRAARSVREQVSEASDVTPSA